MAASSLQSGESSVFKRASAQLVFFLLCSSGSPAEGIRHQQWVCLSMSVNIVKIIPPDMTSSPSPRFLLLSK